jgi:hypothetical protein
MDNGNPEIKRYLTELCAQSQGDTGVQVSMFEVGAAIGLEKAEAGMIAEELIIDGRAELKNLSGGISITPQGVAAVQGKVGGPALTSSGLQLGNGLVLGDNGRKAVEKIIGEIRAAGVQRSATYEQFEEIVVDIKTIETQMLSPHPKIAVIREILRSLHTTLTGLNASGLAEGVNALILS